MCQHGPKDIFLGSDNPNVLETCRSVLRLLRDIQSDLFQPYLGRGTFKCWYKAAKNSKCAKYSLFLAQTVQRYKVGSKYLLVHMFIQLDWSSMCTCEASMTVCNEKSKIKLQEKYDTTEQFST